MNVCHRNSILSIVVRLKIAKTITINASKNIVLSTIRNSNYIAHLPTIKHKYAENSIRYCLMHKLNNEVTWASTVEI